MKKIFALAFMAFTVAATSCSKSDNGGDDPVVGDTLEAAVDATANGVWQYFSFAEGRVIGYGDESADSQWFASDKWDMAVSRYSLRFNGGPAYTSGGQGGVYTCDESLSFANILSVPEEVTFSTDETITTEGMAGTTTTVKSDATVIVFKTDADGSLVMPPVYLKAPVYIVRTADGESYYKVEFTQYKDENNVSGMVEFNYAEIER